jgi:hypothetical protein
VILADADIGAGMNLGAALPNDDRPAVIASPPYALTPSRFECESRPLRELPPAFLCAICLP